MTKKQCFENISQTDERLTSAPRILYVRILNSIEEIKLKLALAKIRKNSLLTMVLYPTNCIPVLYTMDDLLKAKKQNNYKL